VSVSQWHRRGCSNRSSISTASSSRRRPRRRSCREAPTWIRRLSAFIRQTSCSTRSALSTLVATDWKNVQGQGQPIEQIEQSCIQQTVQKGKVQGTILTIEKCMAECSPQFIRRIYRKVYMTSGQCDANLRLPSRPQSTAFTVRRVVISRPAAGRRLSGPKWLVTCARTVTHLGTNRARRRVTSLPLQSCTQPRPSAPFSQKVVQYSRSRGASPRNRWGGHFPPLLSRWCS